MENKYSTLKIPKEYRKSVDILRARVAQKGIDNLPDKFKKSLADCKCPMCHQEMQPVATVGAAYHCPNCGFSKPVFEIQTPAASPEEILKAFGVTAIIMLGIYTLAKLLES
ncbi:hypothetical protein ES706_03256 [subsurface metagenome]